AQFPKGERNVPRPARLSPAPEPPAITSHSPAVRNATTGWSGGSGRARAEAPSPRCRAPPAGSTSYDLLSRTPRWTPFSSTDDGRLRRARFNTNAQVSHPVRIYSMGEPGAARSLLTGDPSRLTHVLTGGDCGGAGAANEGVVGSSGAPPATLRFASPRRRSP